MPALTLIGPAKPPAPVSISVLVPILVRPAVPVKAPVKVELKELVSIVPPPAVEVEMPCRVNQQRVDGKRAGAAEGDITGELRRDRPAVEDKRGRVGAVSRIVIDGQ